MQPTYRQPAPDVARCAGCRRRLEQRDRLYRADGAFICPRCLSFAQLDERQRSMRLAARRSTLAMALCAAGYALNVLLSRTESTWLGFAGLGLAVLLYVVSEVLSPRPLYLWLL